MLDLTYNSKFYGYIFICYCVDLYLGMFCDVNKTNELMHVSSKC
jgi:hypothetical protein